MGELDDALDRQLLADLCLPRIGGGMKKIHP
jgi:hypothetical protein